MKKKLDLNQLLSKYQGVSNTHSGDYYNPPREYDYARSNKVPDIEQDFYQSRQIIIRQEERSTQPLAGNFQKSKSQCEQNLIRIKDQLKRQVKDMQVFSENAYKHIHEKFQANHQKIKRQILELLDRAFKDNERYITQELKKQSSSQPAQFAPVHKQITKFDQEINRLLYGLKGNDYRKNISQIVMTDFQAELKKLRDNIQIAKDSYMSSLGQVEPDRRRIDCIREDLQNLFKISKKNPVLVQSAPFEAWGGIGTNRDQSTSQVQPQQQSQRQRKSFFNFANF